MSFNVREKLIAAFLFFGAVPMLILGAIAYSASNAMEEGMLEQLESDASQLANAIDRSLFERYGDVQAFCLNRAVLDQESWYKSGPDENTIVDAMNSYVATYGIYYLCILVDLEGRVIAVNSMDSDGSPLNTDPIYDIDFSDREWFQRCANGEFTTKREHTSPGNTASTGTYIEDVHIDPEVKLAYGNDSIGLALGFSAPPMTRTARSSGTGPTGRSFRWSRSSFYRPTTR